MDARTFPIIPGTPPRLDIHLHSSHEPLRDFNQLVEIAKIADDLGIDRVSLGEHLVLGEKLEFGPHRRYPIDPDGAFLDPLIMLSVIAGVTRKIRLGTGILIAGLRRPIALAKQTSTLDVLSAGRLDLGVGVGWQKEEYEAAGLDFALRGRLLDDCLDICRLLWNERRASYSSDSLTFDSIHQMPKPVQNGGVPIWVSGSATNARMMTRLITHASGWLVWPMGQELADLDRRLELVRTGLTNAGRDPATLAISVDLPTPHDLPGIEAAIDRVRSLLDRGVTDFLLHVPSDPQKADAVFSTFLPEFRKIAANHTDRRGQ